MQDRISSVNISHIEPSPETEKAHIPYQFMETWFTATEHAKALKKLNDFMDIIIEKLTSEIGGEEAKTEVSINPVTQEIKVKIKENFDRKWEKGQKLAQLLSDLKEGVTEGDEEKIYGALTQTTQLQFESNTPNTFSKLQKTINSSLKPLLSSKQKQDEERVDDLLLHLYFGGLTSRAVEKWGKSLPHMRAAVMEKLEDQVSAMPENETPFKDASEKLLKSVSSEEGDTTLLSFFDEKTLEEKKEKLLSICKQGASAASKNALMKGAETAANQTSNTSYEDSLNTENIEKGALSVLRDIIDPTQPTFNAYEAILRKLLAYAQQHPEMKGTIDQLVAQFKKMQQAASEGKLDYNMLNNFGLDLERVISGLQNNDFRIQCLTDLKGALLTFKDNISTGGAFVDNLLASVQKQLDQYTSALSSITEVEALIRRLANGEALSQADYIKLSHSYVDLISKYSQFPESVQKRISDITEKMQNTTVQGVSLLQACTFCYVYDFIPTKKDISLDMIKQICEKLKNKIAELKELAKQNPALTPFLNSLTSLVTENPNLETLLKIKDPFSGNTLFKAGKTVPPPFDIDTSCITNWHFEKSSGIKSFEQFLSDLKTDLQKTVSSLTTDKATYIRVKEHIVAMQAQLDLINKVLEKIDSSIIAYKSLPEDFYDLVMNGYMPLQEARLRALAARLYFMNFGGSFFNTLARPIDDWNLAHPPYKFETDSWYKSHATDKDTTAQQIIDHAQNEWKDADDAFTKAGQELDRIKAQRDVIAQQVKDKKITQADADKLNATLDGQKADFEHARTNAANLKTALDEIKACKTKDDIAKVMDKGKVREMESAICNGTTDPTTKVRTSKGLSEIYLDVSQSASDMTRESENQQTELQASMMQMQQQWTICTTALQTLNQSYMTCARNILGH